MALRAAKSNEDALAASNRINGLEGVFDRVRGTETATR